MQEVKIVFSDDEFNLFKEVANKFFTKDSPIYNCSQECDPKYESKLILSMFHKIHVGIFQVDRSYWWIYQTEEDRSMPDEEYLVSPTDQINKVPPMNTKTQAPSRQATLIIYTSNVYNELINLRAEPFFLNKDKYVNYIYICWEQDISPKVCAEMLMSQKYPL